jgi:hypothetical protein
MVMKLPWKLIGGAALAFVVVIAVELSGTARAAAPADTPADGALDVKLLCRSWTHSREEGEGIYRPTESKKFPASRFREVYVFKKDGTCEWLSLSPTDAHRMTKGTWKSDDKNPRLIQIFGQKKDSPAKSLQVVELKDDVLKIK